MQYLGLIWDILKGLGKVALFWRVHEAGKERAELNYTEAELEAERRYRNAKNQAKANLDNTLADMFDRVRPKVKGKRSK